jgi:hypothetical protein
VGHGIEIGDVVRGQQRRSTLGDPVEVLEPPVEPELERRKPQDLGDSVRGLQVTPSLARVGF